MINVPNEVMTHSGRFHADDVFSSALLRIVNPDITIHRVSVVPENFNGLVFDIYGGDYDHHGEKESTRENGVPYASFGLLWKEIGPELVGEKAALTFDESFIQPLDIQDNLGGNNQLARVITQANPKWDSGDNSDECFFTIVKFAEFILINEIESMKSAARAQSMVLEALNKQTDGIVVLKVGVPWKSILIPTLVKYVIYPAARGGFNAQAVPLSIGSQECKLPFPIEWRGKPMDELCQTVGIHGINFCHPGGYLLNAISVESALEACKLSLKHGVE